MSIDTDNEWLYNIQKKADIALEVLKNTQVISHRDLDQKNVLWDANEPMLIDRESVGYVNPTLELVGLALDWSTSKQGIVNIEAFESVKSAYPKSKELTDSIETALYAVFKFILIAISVAIFIYADTITNKYKYIDDNYKLSVRTQRSIKGIYDSFQSTFTKSLIIGVMLCILSPIILFITIAINKDLTRYGVAFLLFIVSISILNFIYYGKIKEGFKKLLEIAEYTD